MSIIKIDNLTFGYDGAKENVFENISFQIDTNWKLGLIGRNGKGKTTFLNLLLGKYEYKGKINKSTEFEYFPYEIKNKNVKTIDVINDICDNSEKWEIVKELSLLNVKENVLEQNFNILSFGEQNKVLLASLFLNENKFLLIDEPTNHLDYAGRETVAKYLKSKNGFILISHDRNFLDNTIEYVLSLNKNTIDIQKGNFTSWSKNKEDKDNYEVLKNKKLLKDIKKLEKSSKQKENWSEKIEKSKKGTKVSGLKPDRGFIGHKSAKMMKQSKILERRQLDTIDEKESLLKDIDYFENIEVKTNEYFKTELVIVKDLKIYYDEKLICKDINFTVNKGDRVVIVGGNGTGKSSILKLIAYGNIKHEGLLKIGSNLEISYVSQDTSKLKGSFKDYILENKLDETIFKNILHKLNVTKNNFEKDIIDLSEGQKKKILIAKSLSTKAHLYIWDEPLNFLDIISRIQIEETIKKYNLSMIFVEHDKTFLENIATKTIVL